MNFSSEQINEYKAKNPDGLMLLTSGTKSCIVKKPNRALLSLMLSKSRDPLAMVDILLENCWVDGDAELKEDTAFMYSVMEKIDDIVGKKTVELKNL